MNIRSSGIRIRIRKSLSLAVIVSLLAMPEVTLAGGKHGGHPSHGAKRPPRMNSAHRANKAPAHKAPSVSHAKAPARANVNVARSNSVQPRVNTAQPRVNNSGVRTNTASTTAATAAFSPNTYRYGSGTNARRYQAYGYGRGYRNNYSAGRSGYGRSQGNTRAVVSRLRSVHTSLARLDHDYRGHRVQAMHQLSMAIRQLSHRSTSYGSNNQQGNGLAMGLNNNTRRVGLNGNGNGNGNLAGANGRGNGNRPHLSQAQSDQRLNQALRTTQGVAMQMSHQGTNTSTHARARGHVQRAMHEMNTALTVR